MFHLVSSEEEASLYIVEQKGAGRTLCPRKRQKGISRKIDGCRLAWIRACVVLLRQGLRSAYSLASIKIKSEGVFLSTQRNASNEM